MTRIVTSEENLRQEKKFIMIEKQPKSSLNSRDADNYECLVDEEVLDVNTKKLNTILWIIYLINRQRQQDEEQQADNLKS